MKKLLFAALFGAFFVSCSDDDSGSSVNINQLTKKWYLYSYIEDGHEFLYADEEEDLPCGDTYVEFKTDNTTVVYEVYDCDGSTPLAWTDYGTYSVDGHEITTDFYGDGDEETATITELTSTTLKISYEETYDGETVRYSEVLKSTPQ